MFKQIITAIFFSVFCLCAQAKTASTANWQVIPLPKQVTNVDAQQNVIGAEGCIWTEWVKDAKKMEWELLPRLAALCEVQWTQKNQRNLDSFLQRMLHIHDIYRLKNLNYKEDIEAAVKK